MTWDPAQYQLFSDHRLRPARDLADRIPLDAPGVVWDLGCGTGTPTALLRGRWPDAEIHGLDSSPEMLAEAQGDDIDWVLGDIDGWDPGGPVDVIYSNAALHWLDDHEELLPRLLSHLGPGGVLAAQMPRNHMEPSHRRLFDLARSDRWADRVGHLVREAPVLTPRGYHGMLRPLTSHLDLWETSYQQALTGPDPVPSWTRGSVARPFLEALGDDGGEFFDDYTRRLREDYPPAPDGVTLLAYRRVFIIAVV